MPFVRQGLQEDLGLSGPEAAPVTSKRHSPEVKRCSRIQLEIGQPLSVGCKGPRLNCCTFCPEKRLGLACPIAARPRQTRLILKHDVAAIGTPDRKLVHCAVPC